MGGAHSRFSDVHTHMVKGHGADDHVLGHNEVEGNGAHIAPRGLHSRFSEVGTHLVKGCGNEDHVLAHKSWNEDGGSESEYEYIEVEVTDDEAEDCAEEA